MLLRSLWFNGMVSAKFSWLCISRRGFQSINGIIKINWLIDWLCECEMYLAKTTVECFHELGADFQYLLSSFFKSCTSHLQFLGPCPSNGFDSASLSCTVWSSPSYEGAKSHSPWKLGVCKWRGQSNVCQHITFFCYGWQHSDFNLT